MKISQTYEVREQCKVRALTSAEIADLTSVSQENVYSLISRMENSGHTFEITGRYPKRFKYIDGPKLKCERGSIRDNVLAYLMSDWPSPVEWFNDELSDGLDLDKIQIRWAIQSLRRKGCKIKTNQYGWGKVGYVLEGLCTTM